MKQLAAFGIVIVLLGCGGGSGGGASVAPVQTTATSGEVTVSLRDAAGDFDSYVVAVTSLRLERANGDVVETVPLTTQVDFAQLTDLTEFFTIATVPSGTYIRVVMGLDFSNADIVVQDDAGASVPVVAVDQDGHALTTLQVAIQLPESGHVVIAPGVPAAVTLDFDLAASNQVDLTKNPAVVVVQPFLSVIPEYESDREHRVRGLFAAVDEAAGSVTLKVRPFHVDQGQFGRVTFLANDLTMWEIDGVAYAGAEGLGVLADRGENTPVVAQGLVAGRQLTATTVLAGNSVPWAGANVLSGIVTSRNADTLTVHGARIRFANDARADRGAFTLLVGPDTRVSGFGIDPAVLSEDSISIGQRIVAFGQLTSATTLDATTGHVRMELTQLGGVVVQAGPLVLDLFALGGERPTTFDFSGTGLTSATDADPGRYEIDTTNLVLPQVALNDVVRVRGLVNTFGLAPPDFVARTVIDVDTHHSGALLLASWKPQGGTAAPFSGLSADRIDVDLSDARHVLKLFDVGTTDAEDHIALVAPADGHGTYLVAVRGAREVHVFRDFASLTVELSEQLTAGNLLTQIGAHGRYNTFAVELTTPRASFEFRKP